jgi:hypothetical protein
VEAETHRTLAGYRQSGEWFKCPVDMAVAAIGAAAYRLGEPIASVDPKLTGEIVRMVATETATPIVSSVALAIIKGVIAIPLAVVVWASFYIMWCIITCV